MYGVYHIYIAWCVLASFLTFCPEQNKRHLQSMYSDERVFFVCLFVFSLPACHTILYQTLLSRNGMMACMRPYTPLYLVDGFTVPRHPTKALGRSKRRYYCVHVEGGGGWALRHYVFLCVCMPSQSCIPLSDEPAIADIKMYWVEMETILNVKTISYTQLHIPLYRNSIRVLSAAPCPLHPPTPAGPVPFDPFVDRRWWWLLLFISLPGGNGLPTSSRTYH